MKRKILLVFVTVFVLISVLTFSAFAEDDYFSLPNEMDYSDLRIALLDPYPGSYCVMHSYGIFTFYYPETAPQVVHLNFSRDDFFGAFMGFPEIYNDDDVGGVYFFVSLDENRSFTLTYPYYTSECSQEPISDAAPYVNGDNWQSFDVTEVPTELPPSAFPQTGNFASILGEMIGILVGGIPSIASYIGGGLSTLAAAIFLTGTGDAMKLSVFGGTIIIFSGVALAIGLSKLVVGWLTSLGASD